MRLIALIAVFISAPLFADISYPVNVDTWKGRTAYLDTVTGEVTDRGRDWPATDPDTYACPACGINPGFGTNIVPLLELARDPVPSYDSRMFALNLLEVVCGDDVGTLDANCEGVTHVIKPVWDVAARSDPEKKLAVLNEASAQTLLQMSEEKFRLHVLVQMGLNMMRLEDQALPPKWQAVNDQHWQWLLNKVLPIWNRRGALIGKVVDQTITGGDIDSGWPAVDAGDLPE